MTDLLDRTAEAAALELEDQGEVTSSPDHGIPDPARWMLAALSGSAGIVHLVMVPSHSGQSAVEGAMFVAAGWTQLALAVLVVLRPRRWVLGAMIASSLAFIGVWIVSRTAGLPFGAHPDHAESVSVVDGACAVLEGMLVVLAVALLARPALSVARSSAFALGVGVVAVALASTAIASPAARDHAAGSHGDHLATGADGVAGAGGDHAHGGDAHGDDSAAAADGHADHAAAVAEDNGLSELENGHQHGGGIEELDPALAGPLAAQLALTAPLVERYPTAADAMAAGYYRAGPFAPGLGTHFTASNYHLNGDGDMDPVDIANPTLIYDGNEPDAPLAGFMYMAYGETAPEGFVGPNDHWHYHTAVCIVPREGGGLDTPFGADSEGVTDQMCADVGGSFIEFTGYMVHVWTVPGYESERGTFSEINPRIACNDGSYFTIPLEEIGLTDTVCRNDL